MITLEHYSLLIRINRVYKDLGIKGPNIRGRA